MFLARRILIVRQMEMVGTTKGLSARLGQEENAKTGKPGSLTGTTLHSTSMADITTVVTSLLISEDQSRLRVFGVTLRTPM